MNKLFVHYMIITVCLLISLPASASVGHRDTVKMWHTVATKVKPYRLQMQKLYAEAEAKAGRDSGKAYLLLNRELAMKYPGSTFYGNGGTLNVNDSINIVFDKNWNILTVRQNIHGLVKQYDFQSKTLELSEGPNRIKFKLDLKTPEFSSFGSTSIPAINATATEIWARKGEKRTNISAFTDILNDAYDYRIGSVEGLRMDTLSAELLSDPSRRQYVLDVATDLYSNNKVPLQSPAESGAAMDFLKDLNLEELFQPLLENFHLIFWPLIALLVVLVVLKLLALNRLRRRAWKHVSKDDASPDDTIYESRKTLYAPAEQAFYAALQKVVNSDLYQIKGKTRLADLVQVRGSAENLSAFNRIKANHVDCVIIEKGSSRILGVIDLDDDSQHKLDRIARGRLVDDVLKQSGIPILHVAWNNEYLLQELEASLVKVLGMSSR